MYALGMPGCLGLCINGWCSDVCPMDEFVYTCALMCVIVYAWYGM